MRGQRATAGTITQWIDRHSSKKGFVRVRNFIKVDQSPETPARVREAILRGEREYRGWMRLERWTWIVARGAIPPHSEVIHRVPPAEMQRGELGPPDITVDDINNLLLVARGGVNQKIRLTSGSIRKHRMRRRAAVAKSNSQRGRISAAGDIRPGYWYPVAADRDLIIMMPSRTRKAIPQRIGQGGELGAAGVAVIPMRGRDLLGERYEGWRREIPDFEETADVAVSLPLADVLDGERGELADAA